MQSYIVRQTNSLLRTCSLISKDHKLKVVPYPSERFNTVEELENYNHNLTSMIKTPHFFYLGKDKLKENKAIKLISNTNVPDIPDNYFNLN